jgi:hypothetical protein
MNLYIFLETYNREFLSKLLLAMETALVGVNAYIGRIKPYLLRDFFVPGVILDKSNTPSTQKINELTIFKKKKFIITSLDEEAGLFNYKYADNKSYSDLRFSDRSIELADKIFTWGKFNFFDLKKNLKNIMKSLFYLETQELIFGKKNLINIIKKKVWREINTYYLV